MGIPKFFRWLTRRYPMILQTVNALEDVPPVDNLYLDLNGIVHNAIHGNDPKRHERISKLDDLEELWAAIMRSIDELVHVAKPKKVLFLAVDGVAPRAKMNQQRARRFKSAKEREMLTNQLRAHGKNVPEMFDTNAISPGTEFMVNLCNQLHFFLKYKLNTDPLYQNLRECIISDGHVPGEGEHKMLDYIRKERTKPNYDPNTRHCFYGADADLIMLSLLTHEPHFTIIREEHVVKKQVAGGVQRVELSMTNQFQLIHISLLREYFVLEYRELAGKLRMRWDIERIIDDFIFFCFFIGNDFLPNISALDIGEGSLDKLIDLYKLILPNMDDYITYQGVINWQRAEQLIWVLGEHEDEVYRDRLDSAKSEYRKERIVSVTQDINPLAASASDRGNRDLQTFNFFKEKIFQKKVDKVAKLKAKGDGKKYKKFLITKMFREDAEHKVKIPKEIKNALVEKFTALYNKATSTEESKVQINKEAGEMHSAIAEINEDFFSDLCPEDIPDDCVSDVDDNVNAQNFELLEATVAKVQSDSITNAAAAMVQQAEDANLRFMQDFVKLYAQNPGEAKTMYYMQKVHIDITTPEGVQQRAKMMKKYLEGIQWVMFYYYRGAQHWRWYYPFHYAPLIGDFGNNLVQLFLNGNPKISTFEVDYNCPEETEPYTPFQQLLSIMPIRSFKLLPSCYRAIATNELKDFFPDDFSVDLNGKTLAWEAIVLIPFVDQSLFLETETKMLQSGALFTDKETARNNWKFIYHDYKFAPSAGAPPLPSTLTNLKSLAHDQTRCELNEEYKNVGESSFTPTLLPGCKCPCVGYPSFQQLGIIDISYQTIVVRKVQFKKVLVKVPQCREETQPEFLEDYLQKLAKASHKSVYVDLPYQIEAFPMYFEDQFSVYTLYGDEQTNHFTIQQSQQQRSYNEWEGLVRRVRHRLSENGIDCPPETTNVLVTCSKVLGVNYVGEFENHYFYKTYQEKLDIVPLSLLVRRRDPSHYLNVDNRVRSIEADLKIGQTGILMKTNLFGLMGKIDLIDQRKQLLKLAIDKKAEEAKVHDPFMGEKHLKALQNSKNIDVEHAKAYFGELDVDAMLGLNPGTTARVTSSFMMTYKDPKTKEKCMVDIGLNMKSWTKQMHVAGYIRFIQTGDTVAVNQYDGYEHNQFARGSKHVRSHWEYSLATVEVIKAYYEKFPEVFVLMLKYLKKNQSMPQLKDLYGNNKDSSVEKLKQILVWIDEQPVSQLPFVEMGFDALTPEMIKSLNHRREAIQSDFQPCSLVTKPYEFVKSSQLFVEKFPFWSSPFAQVDISKYHVGDRVMNINSTQRNYVPFGLRGTIVGKTQKQVMVCFDEQYLQGTDINGHCEMYRGGIMNPNNLINLTKKFKKQQKENPEVIQRFTEINPNADPEEHKESPQLKQSTEPKSQKEGNAPRDQPKQKKEKPKNNDTQNSIPQKQASTGYAQTAFYKAKSYKPVQQVEQPQKPIYQPRAKLQDADKKPAVEGEAKINVLLTQDPAIQSLAELPKSVDQPVDQPVHKPVDQPVYKAAQSKDIAAVDSAIIAVQPATDAEIQKQVDAGDVFPQMTFKPLATDLKISPEFQKLLEEMQEHQPRDINDMMVVLESLMEGYSKDASSKSQAMMNPTSKPFFPSQGAPDQGKKPE